jgi:hypothetical protein
MDPCMRGAGHSFNWVGGGWEWDRDFVRDNKQREE